MSLDSHLSRHATYYKDNAEAIDLNDHDTFRDFWSKRIDAESSKDLHMNAIILVAEGALIA